MKNKRVATVRSLFLIGFLLFLAAVGYWTQAPNFQVVRARYGDPKETGGKGLRLLLARLGYTPSLQKGRISAIPRGTRVWLILDPETKFTRAEADILYRWVRDGGTLVWCGSAGIAGLGSDAGIARLGELVTLNPGNITGVGGGRPQLRPLSFPQPSVYSTGVKAAASSGNSLPVDWHGQLLPVASNKDGTYLARVEVGRGRVFLAPDALLFSNMALANPDNAVLVTNLIRAHATEGAIVFDERSHGGDAGRAIRGVAYYLWRPPARWAVLQLALAVLLVGLAAGRRFGANVPLPDRGPVTRASQFALAMGGLFGRAGRPRAAARVVGETFRRRLARRLGLSPADPDAVLAARAHEISGISYPKLEYLLLQSRVPADNETQALQDARAMEDVLRQLGVH